MKKTFSLLSVSTTLKKARRFQNQFREVPSGIAFGNYLIPGLETQR